MKKQSESIGKFSFKKIAFCEEIGDQLLVTFDDNDVLYLSKEILKYGIGGIFPTLVTDSAANIKRAVAVIKEAAAKQTAGMAKILGVHLEGIFVRRFVVDVYCAVRGDLQRIAFINLDYASV